MSERSVALQLCTLDVSSPHDLMRNIKHEGRNIPSCRQAGWPGRWVRLAGLAYLMVRLMTGKVGRQVGFGKKRKAGRPAGDCQGGGPADPSMKVFGGLTCDQSL